MNVLIAACAIFTLVTLLMMIASVRQTRRGRLLRASGSLVGGAGSALVAIAAAFVLISYVGYERLTAERVIGAIEFSQEGPQEFTARLMIDGQLDRLLPVRGDEWQLDARIISWKPPATLLGLEPVYALERLSGRFASVAQEQTAARSVHALGNEGAFDLWRLARLHPRLAPGVDAYYGTATYLPMADGARFRITLSRDALIARPINEAARKAVGDWELLAE